MTHGNRKFQQVNTPICSVCLSTMAAAYPSTMLAPLAPAHATTLASSRSSPAASKKAAPPSRKRKGAPGERRTSSSTREERAAAERKRTRRIAALISKLRSEVVEEMPSSGIDRISVLDNARVLIGRLRSRVALLQNARADRASSSDSPSTSPETTPNSGSGYGFAGAFAPGARASMSSSATTVPAPTLPSFSAARFSTVAPAGAGGYGTNQAILHRLIAENAMLRKQTQRQARAAQYARWAGGRGLPAPVFQQIPEHHAAAQQRMLAASAGLYSFQQRNQQLPHQLAYGGYTRTY